jgi:hypothetical protein
MCDSVYMTSIKKTVLKTAAKVIVKQADKAADTAKTTQAQASEKKAGGGWLSNAAKNTASTLSEQFRKSHSLKPGVSDHDARHVLLGQGTNRLGENVVNAAENSVFKDLEKKSTKQLTGDKKALQSSFDGFVDKQKDLATKAKKEGTGIVNDFRKGKIDLDTAYSRLNTAGIRSRFDGDSSKMKKDGSIFRSDREQTARFLDNQVTLNSKAPSRAESLSQYKSIIRNVAALEAHNKASASDIIKSGESGAKTISYDVPSSTVATAHESVDKALSGLK